MSSPPAGSAGLPGFVQALRGNWRGALLRFAGSFLLLALLWLALAPVYAHLLAGLARPLMPLLESAPDTRYLVEGTAVVAERPFRRRAPNAVDAIRQPLRDTVGQYPPALLAALILATPGWSWRRRSRALAWSLGLLVLTDLVAFLVTIEYTKLWPTRLTGGIAISTDYSRSKMILFDWLYAFFEFMGRGFFALLLYWGAVALTWGRPDPSTSPAAVGRNAPCPCGSGLKAKRCCGG